MRKLYPSEKSILSHLIFPESYHVILEETGLPEGALRDDLINLISFRFVEVIDYGTSNPAGSAFYDSDNMQDYSYRATQTGLKQIRQTA
ncbi:MAG: hypothetical protein MI700_12750 [Balneolales bacterium]|nr:hypothetical protein [Balneolales bacterium]